MTSTLVRSLVLLACLSAVACKDDRAKLTRAQIVREHAPRVAAIVREDLHRHAVGLQAGANRLAAGFVKVSGEQQETEMRKVLKLLRSPKKGVPELVISPMSFMAVVGMDGVALARDAEPDKMKGMKLGELFPSVRAALAGTAGMEIGSFASLEKGGEPSVSIVMAAPAHFEGKVVGALVLGIPLWRLQQRLSKQLQMEEADGKPGLVLWAYVYQGDKLHKHGTPPDLDTMMPDAATRKAGLAKSPGGYTGELQQLGYWYGYGVLPLRSLGPDLGVVIVRMEAQD
jgi:hypothetical protein